MTTAIGLTLLEEGKRLASEGDFGEASRLLFQAIFELEGANKAEAHYERALAFYQLSQSEDISEQLRALYLGKAERLAGFAKDMVSGKPEPLLTNVNELVERIARTLGRRLVPRPELDARELLMTAC